MSDQGGTGEAGWQPDPHGRHEYRYWDGTSWTDQVSDGGVVSSDPPGDAPTGVSEPAPGTATVAQPVASGPPVAGGPTGPPGADTPAYVSPPGGGKRKFPIGILALIGLAVAAIVAALVIFVFGGDDGGGGTGDFAGTISDDEPFAVRSFDLDAGEAVRIIVEPDGDLDAQATFGVDPEVATSEIFAGTDDLDVDDLLSDYGFFYDDLFSENVDGDLSADLSEGLSDDFSDFQDLIDEELPSLSGAGVPFGTENFGEEGDPEGIIFLAPVEGEYSLIVHGAGSEGDFDAKIETTGPDEDFEEIDPDEADENSALYYELIEPHRDFLCEEDFWGGDAEDVTSEAESICDDDTFEDLLSGDTSSDFSDDFTSDFSDDFSSDFSDDFSSDFSDDFSSDFSDDFDDEFIGEIGVGDTESGFINTDSRDVYTIEGDGSTITIDVFGTFETGGLDPTVTVVDSSGSEIGFDDDGGPAGNRDSQLEVSLDSGESYDIIVAGFSTSSGDYEIAIS